MWPIDNALDELLARSIEPRMDDWLRKFFASHEGKQLLSELIADMLSAWMMPTPPDDNILTDVVLQLVKRMADNPSFRQRVIDVLNPHWTAPPRD